MDVPWSLNLANDVAITHKQVSNAASNQGVWLLKPAFRETAMLYWYNDCNEINDTYLIGHCQTLVGNSISLLGIPVSAGFKKGVKIHITTLQPFTEGLWKYWIIRYSTSTRCLAGSYALPLTVGRTLTVAFYSIRQKPGTSGMSLHRMS